MLGIRAKTKCDDDRPCKRCKTRDLACQKSDGRKSPDQRNRSDTRAEQSFSAETLLPTPAPYTPQLEQLGPHFGMENADSYQLNDDPFASGIADSDFGFPDFFEQIMMPDIGTAGAHEHTSMPLNVADFTQGEFWCLILHTICTEISTPGQYTKDDSDFLVSAIEKPTLQGGGFR